MPMMKQEKSITEGGRNGEADYNRESCTILRVLQLTRTALLFAVVHPGEEYEHYDLPALGGTPGLVETGTAQKAGYEEQMG